MLSRIFWVGLAGLALVTGMILQDGGRMFHWADRHTDVAARTERAIEAGVERAVAGGVEKMQVVGSDGQEMDVTPETKRALADAVGRLVKAETNLAMLRVRDAGDKEMQAAQLRRDQARTEVETLKAAIDGQGQGNRDAIREQIRADIRETVRDAVGN